LNPDDLGSPIGAALSSFVAFAIGASLPLIPFLLGASNGVIIAAAISGAALFVVGALLSLFSGKNAWLSGLRMPPSAPSRLRRPTASDRCSTSPPPESRRRILLKFDATCRHPDRGEQLNWTFIAFTDTAGD